jgi:molybdate transport system substrate-binding protein
MIGTIGRVASIAGLFVAQATFAGAAEIKVFSTIGVKGVLEELIPQFEKASGHKLNVTWSTAALLTKRVQDGDVADALILVSGNIDVLTKDGKIAPGSATALPKSIFAFGVKKGAPKPDISTVDALKKTLLAAKGISYANPALGGASGIYMAKQIERMGITEQLKAKTHYPPPSGNAGNLVVSGEAELAVQQEPEVMSVVGVDMVGPLPAELNNITTYAAGPGAGTTQADAANALIRFLHTPEAQAVFKARGLKPEGAAKAS